MSRKPIEMRKIKEILRLCLEAGLTQREAARACQTGKSTVRDYLGRARVAQLTWETAKSMSDDELDRLLFEAPPPGKANGRPLPDWAEVHLERRSRTKVTLQLLWEEYRAAHPDGLGYSQFCERYHAYQRTVDVTMRQVHVAGEKLFVDYAGDQVEIVDRQTGEIRRACIFVGVLGASNYTYAEATWTQGLADWIGSHVRMLDYLGGVPRIIVPDNLKSAVKEANYYDPVENPTYAAFAEHYKVAVIPTRPRKPRDKAKVEAGVQVVQRWLLAGLRKQRFHSLPELNEAIGARLEKLNERPFRKLPGSRRSLFEANERSQLRPLPVQRYTYGEWKDATVNIDYHIEIKKHYYSVPYQLARQKVAVRVSAATVEIFHRGQRVASHARDDRPGLHSTIPEHMPAHHAFVANMPVKVLDWASRIGPRTLDVIHHILASRQHPAQGLRAALGILRLANQVGNGRLEAACQRALAIGAPRYRTVRMILEKGQDRLPLPAAEAVQPMLPDHENLRGASYYQEGTDAAATDA